MNMRCTLVGLLIAALFLANTSASARDEGGGGDPHPFADGRWWLDSSASLAKQQTATTTSTHRNLVSESSPTFSHASARAKGFNPEGGVWYSGAFAPQEATFRFRSPRTISRMTFRIEQDPPGETDHLLLINGQMVYRFSGFTRDNQVLMYTATLDEVRTITIRTTKSPSHVAWRGVELFGY